MEFIILLVVGVVLGLPLILLITILVQFEKQSQRFDDVQSAIRELREEMRGLRGTLPESGGRDARARRPNRSPQSGPVPMTLPPSEPPKTRFRRAGSPE